MLLWDIPTLQAEISSSPDLNGAGQYGQCSLKYNGLNHSGSSSLREGGRQNSAFLQKKVFGGL